MLYKIFQQHTLNHFIMLLFVYTISILRKE